MPIPDMTGLPPFAQFQDMVDKMNTFVQQYNNLLLSLDSLNVVSLTADHIDAGTLNAGIVTVRADYDGGAFIEISANGIRINDGTRDTFKADTAGFITLVGALFQTIAGEYPRLEINSNSNLLTAYLDETNYIALDPNLTGKPAIRYKTPTIEGFMGSVSDFFWIHAIIGNLQLSSNGRLVIKAGAGFPVEFDSWDDIKNSLSGRTLQQDLDALSSSIPEGTYTVITYSGGVPTSGRSLEASDIPSGINAGKIGSGTVSNSEYATLDGVTGPIQTQLNGKADKSLAPINTPGLLGGWSNLGGTFEVAAYFKNGFDEVEFEGIISGGATAVETVLFNVDVAYRPLSTLVRVIATNNGTSIVMVSVQIRTNGDVVLTSVGGNAWLNLSDIKPYRTV